MKNVGILLPVFSLPGTYGIGDFGSSAYKWIKLLSKQKIGMWQILPIYPTNHDNSPYSPISSFAISTLYISLEKLKEDGLLDEIPEKLEQENRIDYEKVRNLKEPYFRTAYKNFQERLYLKPEFSNFLKYVNDEYAEFVSLKKANENACWTEFTKFMDKDEYRYQLFLQFIARRQWDSLKSYAEKRNVQIIGDLPIYSEYDSSDVYKNQNSFLLENGKMEYVSGASSDYFNREGQKWGHPLYNFEYQRLNQYEYMIKKYSYAMELFDIVRIDHFRAFDTYYKIPIDATPKEGEWIEAPGKDILDAIFELIKQERFIVEDLGDLRKEVLKLRDYYNLTGMKIFEYTFEFDKSIDTCLDTKNMIVYPGNHDNDTIVGWYQKLSEEKQKILKEFLKDYKGEIHEKVIYYLLSKPYRYAVFMIQDILGLGTDSRINSPGIGDNQWNWKLKNFDKIKENINKIFREKKDN